MPYPGAARRPVSTRVLGRHAPAGDDRDGDRERSRACSSPTSRRPLSTSRFRPRSSRCCKAAQKETHAAIVLITHDLGLIAELADRVVVMYAGTRRRASRRLQDLQLAAASVHDRPHEQPGEARCRPGSARADPRTTPEPHHPSAGMRFPPPLHGVTGPGTSVGPTYRRSEALGERDPTSLRLSLRGRTRGGTRRRGIRSGRRP